MLQSESKTESIVCIHPVLEERGQIQSESSYRVSLKDCLACSGCAITEDDIDLLAHQQPTEVFQTLSTHPGFKAIISSNAIANLAASQDITIAKAFSVIKSHLVSIGASSVESDSVYQLLWRKLLVKTYNETTTKPFIISRCPGAVLFFERKSNLGDRLAQIKPFPHLYALLKKQQDDFVLNIAPCFDRKLETGRFPDLVDATLTISELAPSLAAPEDVKEAEEDIWMPEGNDVLAMIKMLKTGEISVKERRGITEYQCDGLTGAFVCGEAALRQVKNQIDNGRCKYDIIEANYCPKGCSTGGGLIRGTSPALRKKMVSETMEKHQLGERDLQPDDLLQNMLIALEELDIKAEYKSVEAKSDIDLQF